MLKRQTVMISSTIRDLPQHRKEVMHACLSQSMFPTMMEHLPASDKEANSASLRLVDEADIYVGVFAYRYGYVPRASQISITEMEYNRAVHRGIPRLIFIIDGNQTLADFKIRDIDVEENARKLANFKARLQRENTVNFFKSPHDLRAHAVNSLSELRLQALLRANPDDFPAHVRPQHEYLISHPNPKPKSGAKTVTRRAPPSKESGEKNAARGGAKKGAKKR
jgi:Domain of unknown function (DUF4062)